MHFTYESHERCDIPYRSMLKAEWSEIVSKWIFSNIGLGGGVSLKMQTP